jgi:hypothetical protein
MGRAQLADFLLEYSEALGDFDAAEPLLKGRKSLSK